MAGTNILRFILVMLALAVLCSLASACAAGSVSKGGAKPRLVILQNDKIMVGIIPRIGGRVVMLCLPDGENILHSDRYLWDEPEGNIPSMKTTQTFKAYNGHIVWVGPQDDWWKQQDVTDEHWDAWPPDPYLIYGDFKIEEETGSYIKMVGPESPITGVKLIKEITLLEDGSVKLKVTAENIRDTDISWDLWSNTRVNGHAPSYAYVGKHKPRIDFNTKEPEEVCETPSEIIDGFFVFKADEGIPEGNKATVAKMFSQLDKGIVAAFTRGCCFLKKAEPVPLEKIHPKQAFCEIFNNIKPQEKESLLELEMHGEYKTLKPGGTMLFKEIWQVIRYSGPQTREGHIKYLKKQLGILESNQSQ